MYAKIAYGFWKRRSSVSSLCSREKWRNLASSSIKQSMKSQKQCVHPSTLLLWQKVCVKLHHHQFTIVLYIWTFRTHHWDEFCIKTLVWCHTKFNWFRSWRQLTIQCVFTTLSRPAIRILAKKNHLFRRSSFLSWRVCQQAKLSHLGHRKPARIHWKADATKTSHCSVAIFLRK